MRCAVNVQTLEKTDLVKGTYELPISNEGVTVPVKIKRELGGDELKLQMSRFKMKG
jgi:hypothetical protein